MKAIRIILLILIIIGIIALITQKTWVPILVEKIVLSETKPIVIPEVQPNLVLQDGRQCYTHNQDATTAEPYATTEFIDVTISGTKVTGTKKGTQSGPGMTNGYEGGFVGELYANTITGLFSYTIEGSKGIEKEIYRTNKTGIEKLRYPLVEEKGTLIPDTTKEFNVVRYARVGCEPSN